MSSEHLPEDAANDTAAVDMEMPVPGFRKKRLLIDEERILFGATEIPVSAVESVSYGLVRTSFLFFPVGFEFNFSVTSPGARIKVGRGARPFFRERPLVLEIFSQIVAASEKFIEPSLVAAIVSDLEQGKSVAIHELTLDRSGITGKAWTERKKTVPWSEVTGCRVKDGTVYVQVSSDDRSSSLRAASLGKPNGPLVPRLLEIGATLFGQ